MNIVIDEKRKIIRRDEDNRMKTFITELKETLKDIKSEINALYKAIHGNGKAGLKTEHAVLKARVDFLLKAYWALAGIVGTIFTALTIYAIKTYLFK